MNPQNLIEKSSPPKPGRVNVLGVGVSVLNLDLAWDRIIEAVKAKVPGYITVTEVHGVIEAQDDPLLKKAFNESFLTTPDGMPLVWLGLLDGHPEMNRVYGPDLMLTLCDRGRKEGLRHFLYGGRPGVADALAGKLTERFPGLEIVGTYCPPFRPLNEEEEADLIRQMEETKPDITWIGLSTPKQDLFMANYLGRLPTTLMVGVGAAFDFHSGTIPQAPRWIQRSGFEWLYRVMKEPRRLGPRYLTCVPRFLWLIFLQKTGLKKF